MSSHAASLRDDHEQLRLSAVAEMESYARGAQGRRFESRSRYKWLLAVKETTEPIREYAASKHALRAWMELQPSHDPRSRTPLHRHSPIQLRWCDCAGNVVRRDVFGSDEPAAYQVIGGIRHCTSETCRRVVRPADESGWHDYARAVASRAKAHWCSCEAPDAHQVDGVPYCSACRFGIVGPHPVRASEEQCIALYRAVFEAFFAAATLSFTRTAESWVAVNKALRGATGYGTDDGRERDEALLDRLAATTGLPRIASRTIKPRERQHDREREGNLTGLNGNIRGMIWHKQRELGQIERIDRVLQCANREMKSRCGACETQGPTIKLGCSNTRLCHRCRAVRVSKFQKRFERARQERVRALWADPRRLIRANYRRSGAESVLRYGGPWRERFLTLTVPHSGNAHHDVRELQRAWRRFWRLVQDHVVKDLMRGEKGHVIRDVRKHLAYCRVLEVTPGRDWEGHAHIHCWFIGPFIHHELLRHLWGEALSAGYQQLLVNAEAVRSVDHVVDDLPDTRKKFGPQLRSYLRTRRGKHGVPLAMIWWPVVDVRKVDASVASELCKYLVKDGERNARGELELVHPEVFAVMYGALEGQRAISSSRGLMVVIRLGCYCQDCGGVYTRWIVDVEPDEQPQSRGPPGQLTMEFSE